MYTQKKLIVFVSSLPFPFFCDRANIHSVRWSGCKVLCRPIVESFYHGKNTPLNLKAPEEKGKLVLRRMWAYTKFDSPLFLPFCRSNFFHWTSFVVIFSGLSLCRYTCLPNQCFRYGAELLTTNSPHFLYLIISLTHHFNL